MPTDVGSAVALPSRRSAFFHIQNSLLASESLDCCGRSQSVLVARHTCPSAARQVQLSSMRHLRKPLCLFAYADRPTPRATHVARV